MTWTTRIVFWTAVAALLVMVRIALHAQDVPSQITYRTYHVTDATVFPGLPLPAKSMVFDNGVLQVPAASYDVVGTAFKFRSQVLANGDSVTVVTLP